MQVSPLTGAPDPTDCDPEGDAAAELMSRHRRLYVAVFAPALLIGSLVGMVCFAVAVAGGFGNSAFGPRNPAALVVLVAPVAVAWGAGRLLHSLLVRTRERAWRAQLAARHGLDAGALPSLLPERRGIRADLLRWGAAVVLAMAISAILVVLLMGW